MGSSDNKGHGFLKGILIGSVIGGIATFYFSQKERSESLKNKLGELTAKGKEAVGEAIREGKEAAARKEEEIRGEGKKGDK